ncbi:unnamed protein product [Caenorhabditis sp. 36 PRJEB53466]|nr:unnamed protein product [Caenorhabditis sp. 36 PRJEB53466]
MSDRESRSKPKKTVIGTFLGRLSRSKSRGVDGEKKKEQPAENGKHVPVSKSDGNIMSANDRRFSATSHRVVPEAAANILAEEARMSPARRLLNRFSTLRSTGRFRSSSRASSDSLNATPNALSTKTPSEHDLHAVVAKPNKSLAPPSGVPTGAQSETDLRFVTTRDSHRSIPLNEPFGFGDKSPRVFMSENDLTSGSADFPEVSRTPSYLRISCALNGYTKSPKADLTPKVAHGESLVERRQRMFEHPQLRRPDPGFNSPITTSSNSRTSTSECLTPIAVAPLQSNRLNAFQNEMGNNVSTPAPIRDLISKFEQLDLCSAHKNEKEGVENIEPHNFIINEQPVFDEIDLKKDSNGNEEQKESEEPNLKISTDVESDSGISGSSPASSKKNVEILKDTNDDNEQEVTTTTPSDGYEFRNLHDKVKAELEEKIEAASKDLERVDELPEKCADSLRAAHGNASLLVRKKFHKFNELIDKNLKPIADDPMSVSVQDLEGFWPTITMELKGILEEFAKVEKYRAANWDPSAVEEEEVVTSVPVVPKSRPVTARKKQPAMSEETKKKLAEQKAQAEQRRAEMRAQMLQKKKTINQEKPVLGASEDC